MPKSSQLVIASDREIRSVRAVGQRTDFRVKGAPHLQLRVTKRGTKSWAFVYKKPSSGRWTKYAFARYPAVGLAQAKDRAVELAADVLRGKELGQPHQHGQERLRFKDLAEDYLREHEARNARAGRRSTFTDEVARQLRADLLPVIGDIYVEQVKRAHVAEAIEAVAARGAYVAADRVLGLMRAIYNWASATGRADGDPTIGLKRRTKTRPRDRVLSHNEIRAFWSATSSRGVIAARYRPAFRIQLLTGARISEVVEAPRLEFDLDRRTWTIAAERTKSRREHTLPLSDLAIATITTAVRAAMTSGSPNASKWLFPSPSCDAPVTDKSAIRAMARARKGLAQLGLETSFGSHDLRRTMATQLGELGVADETIERILNHAPRSVTRRHYNLARYAVPMREALDAWSAHLFQIVAQEP